VHVPCLLVQDITVSVLFFLPRRLQQPQFFTLCFGICSCQALLKVRACHPCLWPHLGKAAADWHFAGTGETRAVQAGPLLSKTGSVRPEQLRTLLVDSPSMAMLLSSH